MKKFITYLGKLQKLTKLTKAQAYFSNLGILLFFGPVIAPLLITLLGILTDPLTINQGVLESIV